MQTSCPKCSRSLDQTGEATVDGKSYPVFQCEHCIEVADIGGQAFPAAYTFALDDRGRVFDPAELPPAS